MLFLAALTAASTPIIVATLRELVVEVACHLPELAMAEISATTCIATTSRS